MNLPGDTDFGALHARLQIDTPLGAFLGAQRIELLEAVGQHGSIARAAKAVALSYKAAWDAVDDMNNLASEPLVIRSAGGPRGGSTTLTAYGLRLIAFYRALEQEHQSALRRLQQALAQTDAADVMGFSQLLKRFSMQSSARNQFVGTVKAIHTDPVEAQVELTLAPGLDLVAVVTTESLERMKLRIGTEAHAMVKSSSVMLTTAAAERFSARNRLAGTVVRLLRGPVNSEVTLQLAGQHLHIASVITDESVSRLGLRIGSEVTAFFKASSVVLATPI
ncbi:MAG: TOBE domain-containing protein [Leptothrix sp. (in: b-proteobacteria)]